MAESSTPTSSAGKSASAPILFDREENLTADTFLRGLWKENPVFVMHAGHVSDPGGHQLRHQCTRHGAGDDLRAGRFRAR